MRRIRSDKIEEANFELLINCSERFRGRTSPGGSIGTLYQNLHYKMIAIDFKEIRAGRVYSLDTVISYLGS